MVAAQDGRGVLFRQDVTGAPPRREVLRLAADASATLEEASVSYFELRPDVARFVTSWQTSSQELATLAAALS